jgi:hypothetical protein
MQNMQNTRRETAEIRGSRDDMRREIPDVESERSDLDQCRYSAPHSRETAEVPDAAGTPPDKYQGSPILQLTQVV